MLINQSADGLTISGLFGVFDYSIFLRCFQLSIVGFILHFGFRFCLEVILDSFVHLSPQCSGGIFDRIVNGFVELRDFSLDHIHRPVDLIGRPDDADHADQSKEHAKDHAPFYDLHRTSHFATLLASLIRFTLSAQITLFRAGISLLTLNDALDNFFDFRDVG